MVTVKLFGTLRLDSGVKEFSCEAAKVSDIYAPLYKEIQQTRPESGITLSFIKACLVAVNGKRCGSHAKLSDGDEVYLFTAVGGG